MLIEQSAYANRWRAVSPAAKAVLALCGIVAAFAAVSPAAALAVAVLLAAISTATVSAAAGETAAKAATIPHKA